MGALLRGFNDVTVAYLAEKMTDKPDGSQNYIQVPE